MIIRVAETADLDRVLEIWREAVDATHRFLAPEDRAALEIEVAGFLPMAPVTLACDTDGMVQGFLIRDGVMVEALFVDPSVHGCGVGSALLAHAREVAGGPLSVDANLQAANALPFYLSRGFLETGRSERDQQGRPYPLVHLSQSE